MTIIQAFDLQLHSCRVAPTSQKNVDLRNILDKIVYPRLESYLIFLEQINSLEDGHSLRSDPTVVEILEDRRHLGEAAQRAEKYLA